MGGAPLEIIKQYIEPQKYVWKPDPSFVLNLPLSADGGEEPGLSARFEGARQLHNAVLGESARKTFSIPDSPPEFIRWEIQMFLKRIEGRLPLSNHEW